MQHLRRQAGVAADDGVSDHGKNQARTAVKQAAAGFDVAADTPPGLLFPALRPVQCGKAMTAEKPFKARKNHFCEIFLIVRPVARSENVVIGQFVHVGKQFGMFFRFGAVFGQVGADLGQVFRRRTGKGQNIVIGRRQVSVRQFVMARKGVRVVFEHFAETAHQIGAFGIVFCAVLQQPQCVYAVFRRRRRRGRRGQQRQIGFGGTDFALFQPFGNGIQDGDGGQYQDGGCTKQVFEQAFHDISPIVKCFLKRW